MVLDELEHPIVQAPLAGGPATVALTAEVGNAGGLGFLGAGYQTPDSLRGEIRELRELTPAPFGVNLFVPGNGEVDGAAVEAYRERLRSEAERYGVEVGEATGGDDGWGEKLAVLHEERPPVVSFTFGCPPAEVVGSLRDLGSEVWVTVTAPAEARIAADAGADALVCQGVEAGGHRATFADEEGPSEELGVLALLRLVAAEVDLPLVAAGGIADGPGVAAVLAGGASAAQVGTAFLVAIEARTLPIYRAELMSDRPTALTRAFSGRTARGIINRFLTEHSEAAPAAYPHVHHATTPIRAAARKAGDAEGFNLWAGQAHALAQEKPAAEIVQDLSEGAREALEAAIGRMVEG